MKKCREAEIILCSYMILTNRHIAAYGASAYALVTVHLCPLSFNENDMQRFCVFAKKKHI
jgi:hypothetical protein